MAAGAPRPTADGRTVRVGVHLPQFGGAATREGVIAVARLTEEAGLDSVWVGDHIAFPCHPTTPYPYKGGGLPMGPQDGWLEAVATLMLAGAVTERVTLGTSVIVAPMRHPLLIAKEIGTVDALSGGRVVFGTGFGWWRDEFEAVEAPFKGRAGRLDEQIGIVRKAWTEGTLAHDGEHWRFAEVAMRPVSPQPGGPPIWISGMSESTRERAARYGDGWHAISPDPREIAAGREDVRRRADAHGRDPGSITTSTSMFMADDPERAAEEVAHVASFGLDHIVLSAWWSPTVAETCARLEQFATAVLPALRSSVG